MGFETLAIVGGILAVVGSTATAVTTGVTAYNQGKAQKAMYDYNAKLAEDNAKVARAEAAENERRARVNAAKLMGKQRASFGSAGLAFDGSAFDLFTDTFMESELEARWIQYAGEVGATGQTNQSSLYRTQGQVAYNSGRNTLITSGISAIGEIGSGALAMSRGRTPKTTDTSTNLVGDFGTSSPFASSDLYV